MKTRNSLVSNSSSSSFIIVNKSKEQKTIVDLVKENPQLIQNFIDMYNWYNGDPKYTQDNLIISADQRLQSNKDEYTFNPKSQKKLSFGDEDGDLIGIVFDYILREKASSKSFRWKCVSCRGAEYGS